MSLVSQGRGVSGGTLGGLGVVGSQCLGGSGSPFWVSDPFPIATPSLSCSDPPSQLQPQFHQRAGVVQCGVRLSGKGGHRDRPSCSRVLQSPLCHSQNHRGLATCHRPLTPQRLSGALQLSHGDCPVRYPVSPSGGLDGVPGSPGRLPPGSCSSVFSPLPEVLRGGCGVSVSSPVLRPFLSPSGVHPRHGCYFVHHASPRVSSSPLFGRLSNPGLHLPGTSACEGLPPLAMSSPRGHSKSFEELFCPDSDAGLSRDDPRDFFQGFPDPQTDSEVLPPSSGVLIRPSPSCVGLAESSRDDVVNVRHRSRLSAPHVFPSTSPQCGRSFLARRGSCLLGRWLPQGSSVVVRRLPSSRRPLSGRLPPRSLSFLRRFRSGLGCSSRRSPPLRLVVFPLLALFHQPARAPGDSLCNSGISASPPRSDSSSLLGQLYGSGLPAEAGGHAFVVSERSGSGTSSTLRGSVGSPSASVHSWPSQCAGGFPQPPLSSPRLRVDVVSAGFRGAPASLASHHRPLREVHDAPPSGVLLADVRPDVSGHRCDVEVLGRSAGVCLPAVQPSSSGVGEGACFQRPGADVGGSVLASAPVVPGPYRIAPGDPPLPATKEGSAQTAPLPLLPPEPVRASVNCISYLRRSARQAGFSDAVAGQLAHCRRRSTRVNYQAKWVVYHSWCHRHGHSVSRPTVAKVADFLLSLRRSLSLSYSSIASYRSMLSGFFRFILPELSSYFVLHDLLRSFRLEHPLPSSRGPSLGSSGGAPFSPWPPF